MVIPSRKQFRKWSLPSKITYISFLLGIVSLIISVMLWWFPSPNGKELSLSDEDLGVEERFSLFADQYRIKYKNIIDILAYTIEDNVYNEILIGNCYGGSQHSFRCLKFSNDTLRKDSKSLTLNVSGSWGENLSVPLKSFTFPKIIGCYFRIRGEQDALLVIYDKSPSDLKLFAVRLEGTIGLYQDPNIGLKGAIEQNCPGFDEPIVFSLLSEIPSDVFLPNQK